MSENHNIYPVEQARGWLEKKVIDEDNEEDMQHQRDRWTQDDWREHGTPPEKVLAMGMLDKDSEENLSNTIESNWHEQEALEKDEALNPEKTISYKSVQEHEKLAA